MTSTRSHASALMATVVSPVLARLLRSRAAAVLGRRLAVVSYVGRHSGISHEFVVRCRVADADARITVVDPDRHQWWLDFTTPRPMTLRRAGRDHLMSARAVRNGDVVSVTATRADRHVPAAPPTPPSATAPVPTRAGATARAHEEQP